MPGGVEAQTEQALKNMKAIVEAAGSEVGKIAKTLVSFVPIGCLCRDLSVCHPGIYQKHGRFWHHKCHLREVFRKP